MTGLPEWLRWNLQNEEMVRHNNDPAHRRTVAVADPVSGVLVPVAGQTRQQGSGGRD